MFKHVIVRKPGRSLVNGITSSNLGKPNYDLAVQQHDHYINALKSLDVKVKILDASEQYPDAVFVEDTAVLAERCAVITHPGALSRQGEEISIKEALNEFYTSFESIQAPGTLEGGDVMRVGDHFYVGLSARTNEEGYRQFAAILNKFNYSASAVKLEKFLHLKTGLAYLEHNNLLVSGEFIEHVDFKKFNRIIIDETEEYAANCIWFNNAVLIPMGYPKTAAAISKLGYKIMEVDVSEFQKLDGGLSCLSLRF